MAIRIFINGEQSENLSNPMYISSPQDFIKTFNTINKNVLETASSIMKDSIKYQEDKEKELYEALGISEKEWIKIGDILSGIIQGENPDEENNKLEFVMKQFQDFIVNGIFEGVRFTSKYKAQNLRDSNNNQLNNILKKYINFYNEPVKEFLNWYNNKYKDTFYEGKIEPKDIYILNSIMSKKRDSKKELSKNQDLLDDGIIINTLKEGNKLLDDSQGDISDFFGSFKESVLLSIVQNCEKVIELGTTSYWAENSKGKIKLMNDLVDKNVLFYKGGVVNGEKINGIQDEINNYLEKNQIKLDTYDGLFSFEDSVSKNLKADDIFIFEIKGKLKPYGISSKASWSENSDTIKLMSTSYKNVFINMLKGMLTRKFETLEISNFIKYSTYNSLYYYNINEEMKEYYGKTKEIFDKIISYYGYQWLTGGDSEFTHADFLSIYKASDKKYYFIPMSKILKEIQKDLTIIKENNLFPEADNKIDRKTKKISKYGKALNEEQRIAFKQGIAAQRIISYKDSRNRTQKKSYLDDILNETSGEITIPSFKDLKNRIIVGNNYG